MGELDALPDANEIQNHIDNSKSWVGKLINKIPRVNNNIKVPFVQTSYDVPAVPGAEKLGTGKTVFKQPGP